MKRHHLWLFVLWGLLLGCNPMPEVVTASLPVPNDFRKIQLGVTLKNPYSTANLRRAFQALREEEASFSPIGEVAVAVPTTHLYIRFLPKNEQELDRLEKDSALILYEYPLDVEIKEGGNYYHDPTPPEDHPTYQYCAVPVKQTLPTGIHYEILEELCLPHTAEVKEAFPYDVFVLIAKSFALTGNEYTGPSQENTQAKWRPNGRIQVQDWFFDGTTTTSTYRNNPIVGARVRARNWFTTVSATSYTTGWFSTNGTLNGKVEYSIVWESDDWDIRTGSLSQAVLVGPKIEGPWYLTITNTFDRWQAMVHLAAYDYYYRNSYGIKSPPKNSFWSSKLKISTYNETNGENGTHCAPCRFGGGLIPRIYLYNPNRTTDLLYGTAIHELAHASHWELRKGDWDGDKIERRLKESWADGVAWFFTRNRYGQYASAYTYLDNYQRRSIVRFPERTSLVVDLNDDYNQRLKFQDEGLPYDMVKDISLLEIEEAIKSSNGFDSLKGGLLKNRPGSVTQNIEDLFNNWN